ncbi:hypothetical protein HU200_063697 [Digitaria exilis]|uniref:NB-ARC domain-containing protein n=1 Tax=Digitaria exilis TaxID=1010633 RepID=A0A835DYT2_9POAL|nr:hypothetical protein HU200_063697 [Digitaria exilis]
MEAALIKVSEAPIDQPPDSQVKIWTREVRELSYDLEDSIDKFMVRVDGGKQPSKQSFKSFIDRSLKLLTKGKIRHNIATDIKEIRSRIKDVSKRRDRYKLDQVPSKLVERTIDNLRLSALYRKATELVGTEEKSNDLVKRLMGGDNESLSQQVIVSIVGFGGLGKTTLANLVYLKLKGKFDCAAFVYASHNPNMDKIFKNMLYQLDGHKYRNINHETWSEELLISELREFLRHKRYFIVVDDIWNTSVWETIQCALIDNELGSIIVTTTRNLDVAKQAGAVYQLEPLSITDSTKLFYQRIFGSEDECPPDDLVEVSRKILQKCSGVPLAIITIAKDYKINIQDLIWKWIGEGLVFKEQGKTLYEVGGVYEKAKSAIEKFMEMNPNRPILEEDKEEENEIVRRKIRAHAHTIRAAFAFKMAGSIDVSSQ